jgi:UDP-glucose 4-epimerase
MALFLVTGGGGFIGSHLAETLLAEGHSVRILDNFSTGKLENVPAAAEIVVGDVADPGVVARAMLDVDGCFHLAAIASVEKSNLDWFGTHRTNLSGTIAVLDAARPKDQGTGIPVVYASSAAVYGNNTSVPLCEVAEKKPLSAYGADKLGCEQHAYVASTIHRVPTCGLRFFNVYGPRQDPTSPYSGVISIFCDRIRAGQRVTIYGDGQQTRDFVYVVDVVRALLAAMSQASTQGRAYNVCTGRQTSVLELAYTIAEVLDVSIKPGFAGARSGDIRCSVGDPTQAWKELRFGAKFDLTAGLQLMLRSSAGEPSTRGYEQALGVGGA